MRATITIVRRARGDMSALVRYGRDPRSGARRLTRNSDRVRAD